MNIAAAASESSSVSSLASFGSGSVSEEEPPIPARLAAVARLAASARLAALSARLLAGAIPPLGLFPPVGFL